MIKYFVYVRKSQDRSDRQIMSIEGQINEIKRLALDRGYVIMDVLIEQKSAKKPGRPVFNQMIERIQKGEANGILCWKLNRLARNPIDAGTISWLLQGNILQAIHSQERSYLPTDNVLMMQIDFGIANQFIKDLSSDIKRGMRDKARDGWCPRSKLPIGYMHHKEKHELKKKIIPDPDRYQIIKELWRMMETGAYSIVEIKRRADELGLANRNNKPYEIKTFRKLFSNPMYYGKFYWNDENGNLVLWQGKHKAMIDEITFRKIQRIITSRKKETAPRGYVYTYRGLISCGECNGVVSAERKLQVICTNCRHKYSILTNETCKICNTPYSNMINPSMVDKIYYRCTRKTTPSCRQKSITESAIEKQILNLLKNINLPQEVYEFLISHVDDFIDKHHQDHDEITDSLRRKKDRLKSKLKKLLDLQVSGEISSDQASSLRNEYQAEIDTAETQIFEKENAITITKKEMYDYLEFTKDCLNRFQNGDQNIKKELTAYFCSNLKLLDKTLYFSTKKAPDVLSLMQNTLFSNSFGSNL